MTGDFAFRQLARSNFRNQRGVYLEFTIKFRIKIFSLSILFGLGRGGLNATDAGMHRTAFG